MQSSALRSRELETHINWLLRQSGQIDEENGVFINNYAPAVTKQKLDSAQVKSIKLGTPLCDYLEAVAEKTNTQVAKTRFRPKGDGWHILELLTGGKRLSDIDFPEADMASNIEVFVEVTYKRQTDDDSQKLINKLAGILRHSNEEDIRIELKGAGTIVGSELQIKSYENISTYNGLVDPADLFDKMFAWLKQSLEIGLIDP